MENYIIKVTHLSKEYKLGQIGGGTLNGDLQSWWAKVRGKDDPNSIIGNEYNNRKGSFMALDDLSFSIKAGERVGIIGHNGAGKSTLLKLLSRVTAPTKGTIEYYGKIASMLEVGTGFHPELTGRENVYLNGAILGMSKLEIDKKFNQIVEFAEMKQFIDTPVKRYSSGMYVKLAFAVAAHLDSDILIMDEVLAVGDMKFQQKCLGTMSDISSDEGRTILYVSHNMNTVRQLCDRCIVLDHGKIIFDGDVEEGIGFYLGEITSSETHIDVLDFERESDFKNSQLKFQSLELVGKKENLFKVGEYMTLKVDIKSKINLDHLYIRMILKSIDGTPVTMITSKESIFLKKGVNTITLSADISHFVPGKYTFDLISFTINEFGSGTNFDVLRNVMYIDIATVEGFNNNMEWSSKRYGYMYADYITMKSEE